MEMFGGLFALVFAGLCVAGAAGLAWWMLEPINRVAGHLHFSTQFLLIDFIGLMLLIQAALALVGSAIDTGFGGDRSPYWQILAVVVALVLVLWGAAVSVVSRVGITQMLKRLTVIVLLIPATLAIMVASPLALAAFLAAVTRRDLNGVAIAFALGLCLGGAAYVIRTLAFWSLAGSPGAVVLAELNGLAKT